MKMPPAALSELQYHRRWLLWGMLPLMLLTASVSQAGPEQVYQQSLQLAANGRDAEAIAALQAAAAVLPDQHAWKVRMLAAATLLDVKRHRLEQLPVQADNITNLSLASGHARANPLPQAEASWPAMMLAVLLPGAGHAWQGRWRDAGVVAMLVWPMLLLTLWAARRRMGPVTAFFALITVWLWSGTVFSSMSLAERASFEAYMLWWQGLWQASGLQGQPW